MSAASLDEVRTDREFGSLRYRDEDFPGCESFHLPADELDTYEDRLEFWDGATETARKESGFPEIWVLVPWEASVRAPGNVLTVLKARGVAVTRDPTALRELLGAVSGDAAMAAAMACTDVADFRRRVLERDAPHGRPAPDR